MGIISVATTMGLLFTWLIRPWATHDLSYCSGYQPSKLRRLCSHSYPLWWCQLTMQVFANVMFHKSTLNIVMFSPDEAQHPDPSYIRDLDNLWSTFVCLANVQGPLSEKWLNIPGGGFEHPPCCQMCLWNPLHHWFGNVVSLNPWLPCLLY